jgi:AAA family ATP:ADP antiporter
VSGLGGIRAAHAVSARRVGLAPAFVLFSILVAHAVLETARDALFLARLGPQHLASAYLAMAGCAVAAVLIVRGLGVRDPRGMLIRFLVCAAAGTAVLAAAITSSGSAVFVFYVWTGFIITLVVPSFWAAIDRISRVAEAKRVFGMIGAGGVLGAMTGSAIAGLLGRAIAAQHLVTVGAIAFALATVVAAALVPRLSLDDPPVRPPRAEALSYRSRRYVALLLAVGLVSTTALTLGDLTFKRVLAERLAVDNLATAFGAIYTGLNALGLAIQLLVTPRLLARRGVGVTLTVLPAIIIATALGFTLTGAMVAVIALKLGDGGLRHSLHRVSSEILYLPVPTAVRDGGKLVADAIGQRGGQAVAALIALMLASLGATARITGAVTVLIGVGWLLAIARARRAYVAQFRDTLQAGEIQRDVALPQLDADSLGLLSELLSSPNEVEALAALDLLARRARVPVHAFDHPSDAVVHRALALLDGELPPELGDVLGRLRAHANPELRAAALAASTRAEFDRELLEHALDDRDPQVRAAALVGLAARDGDTPAMVEGIGALAAGSTEERLALVKAIGFSPTVQFRPVLYNVLAHGELPVIRQVLHVLAHNPALAELDRVLGLLEDPRLRADVRRVFIAVGRPGLDRLIRALDDPQTSPNLRRHLPRTISRFHSEAAAAALVTRLSREPDGGSEFKILRALGRMRADQPGLLIERAPVRDYVVRAVADAARYATFGDQLAMFDDRASPMGQLIGELLTEKRRTAIERAFRGLGILHPRAGLRSVHDALMRGDEVRRSAAREIVEAVVGSELRPALLAVVDDLSPEQRRARLGRLAPGPFASYEALAATLLADPSESLRCVVAYHVAELRLITLRAELERLRPSLGRPFVVHAFDQAMARLLA